MTQIAIRGGLARSVQSTGAAVDSFITEHAVMRSGPAAVTAPRQKYCRTALVSLPRVTQEPYSQTGRLTTTTILLLLQAGHSTESITHAGHSIAFLHFLTAPVTWTFDILTEYTVQYSFIAAKSRTANAQLNNE